MGSQGVEGWGVGGWGVEGWEVGGEGVGGGRVRVVDVFAPPLVSSCPWFCAATLVV